MGTISVLGDVTVLNGTTLTIDAGSIVEFDMTDSQESGADSLKTELIVEGTLTVTGLASSKVVFTSARQTPDEGDWFGIRTKSSGVANIDRAEIKFSERGFEHKSSDGSTITNTTFSDNEIFDFTGGCTSGASCDLTLTGNTFIVKSGIGIELRDKVKNASIENNTITGQSISEAGISVDSTTTAPIIKGNTISGFGLGAGFLNTTGKAKFTENTVTNNSFGIRVLGGTPDIGTTSSTSTNHINNNTMGISFEDSTANPKVRNNKITLNTYGIGTKLSATPDIGTGGGNKKGNNTFLNNTVYCIWNRSSGVTVDAQGNYFGACVGGEPPMCWSGQVNVGNHLCVEPSGSVRLEMVETFGPASSLKFYGGAPNPMTSKGSLRFHLEGGGAEVLIHIYDVAGRLVRTLGGGEFGPGDHVIHWNGRNNHGQQTKSGIYFMRMIADNRLFDTAKVVVVR